MINNTGSVGLGTTSPTTFTFHKNKLILKIGYDRGWVLTRYDSPVSIDTLVDYLEIDENDIISIMGQFGGKVLKKDLNHIHFAMYSDAEKAIEWVESILMVEKLRR